MICGTRRTMADEKYLHTRRAPLCRGLKDASAGFPFQGGQNALDVLAGSQRIHAMVNTIAGIIVIFRSRIST